MLDGVLNDLFDLLLAAVDVVGANDVDAGFIDANGTIVDWAYEVWSNTHSTRPAAPDGNNNLLASWYIAEPSQPGPPRPRRIA